MERLTRRELWWGSQGKIEKAVNYKVDEERRCITHEGSADFLIADRLAEYEDLEEQGKLHIFPCTIGETVYCVYNKYQKCDSKKEYCIRSEKVQSLDWIVEQEKHKRFGKTVFLTKSAAEQALKEMEGKNGD